MKNNSQSSYSKLDSLVIGEIYWLKPRPSLDPKRVKLIEKHKDKIDPKFDKVHFECSCPDCQSVGGMLRLTYATNLLTDEELAEFLLVNS